MVRIIYVIKIITIIAISLFLSLCIFKLLSFYFSFPIKINLIYLIIFFYLVAFCYLLFKKASHIFSIQKHPFLIVDTILSLEKTHPFYSFLSLRLHSYRKEFLKEFLCDVVKLSICVGLFFLPTNLIKKNKFQTVIDSKETVTQLFTPSSVSPIHETTAVRNEISKIKKIKDFIENPELKKDRIINEIMKLKMMNELDKNTMVKKVLDNNFKEAVDQLREFIKKLKEKSQQGIGGATFTDAVEK
ncbi:MAG: hypothetical protein ACK4NF_07090, partial [Planctomycetota bacterium]